MRARSFGTEVPQDDATWEFIFKLTPYRIFATLRIQARSN